MKTLLAVAIVLAFAAVAVGAFALGKHDAESKATDAEVFEAYMRGRADADREQAEEHTRKWNETFRK